MTDAERIYLFELGKLIKGTESIIKNCTGKDGEPKAPSMHALKQAASIVRRARKIRFQEWLKNYREKIVENEHLIPER